MHHLISESDWLGVRPGADPGERAFGVNGRILRPLCYLSEPTFYRTVTFSAGPNRG
jgi:hypothetical protein